MRESLGADENPEISAAPGHHVEWSAMIRDTPAPDPACGLTCSWWVWPIV